MKRSFATPFLSKAIVPRVFGAVYHMGALYSKSGLPSPVYHANKSYAQVLAEYIKEARFDAVIATHLYGMEALTAAKRFENRRK